MSLVFAQSSGPPLVSDVARSILTALEKKVWSDWNMAIDLVVIDHLRRILGSSSIGEHGRVAKFCELTMA